MSRRRMVPSAVPSDTHGSLPVALKQRVPFRLVKADGPDEADPGFKSFTSTVPASVPSDFHSSTPCVPSLAVKYRVPLTLNSLAGAEPTEPGQMSFTSTVPA